MNSTSNRQRNTSDKRRVFLRICGSVVIFFSGLAVVGWITGMHVLASLSPASIPMAPLTALIFLLSGTLLLWSERLPGKAALVAAVGIGLVASVTLILRIFPVYFGIEKLGFSATTSLEGIPLGFMSPVTAFGFMLTGIALIAILVSKPDSSPAKSIANGAVLLLAGTTFVFLLGYLYGEPILYVSDSVPPALSTILAFSFLSLGLIVAIRNWQYNANELHPQAYSYPHITVFVFFLIGIITIGGLYFTNYTEKQRHEIEKSLESIANLKVEHITYWRNERKNDGEILDRNGSLREQVADYVKSSKKQRAQHPLRRWLETYYAYGEIRAALVDINGNTILSQLRDKEAVSRGITKHISEFLQQDTVSIKDFYIDEHDSGVYMAVLVPIVEYTPKYRPLAVLVLRVDPEYFLFPFLKRWPSESKTGETLIVRRDGSDVLFLNDVRFQTNSALKMRIPIHQTMLPAAMAVSGTSGFVEGVDYRGVDVFACTQHIPGSPWFLVARIDKDEVFSDLRERLFLLAGLVAFLALSTGSWFTMSVRRQRLHYFQSQYEAGEQIKEREFRLRQAEELGHLGHWFYDLETTELTWSDELYRIHGVTKESFRPSADRVLLLMLPEDREIYRKAINNIPESGAETFEYRIPLPDGTIRYAMVRGLVGMGNDGNPDSIYGITLDTTEIKVKERKLEEMNAELTRFTYTVSHDLKSPLVTIRTFLGFLEQDTESGDREAVKKDIGFITPAINKMGRLLDELLEMSRVGRVVNPPEQVSCRTVVEEALAIVAGRIKEEKIDVTIRDVDVMLNVDRPRMVEVWQNLIDNAVKYMGDTKNPSIEIGSFEKEHTRVFFIKDNGMGIDPRYKDKVFGLFEKLHPETEGTGIGLALIKRIVNLHDGEIWFESEGVGQGTCFYFTIPTAMMHQGDSDE